MLFFDYFFKNIRIMTIMNDLVKIKYHTFKNLHEIYTNLLNLFINAVNESDDLQFFKANYLRYGIFQNSAFYKNVK